MLNFIRTLCGVASEVKLYFDALAYTGTAVPYGSNSNYRLGLAGHLLS
ncbi:hypothetical protein [Sodalis-like endosymbiont of Proechinophthirus fluctus]|nr:hypothetical protein [Sodalis-like endosymbiont of Proechinophthirus fluctus]